SGYVIPATDPVRAHPLPLFPAAFSASHRVAGFVGLRHRDLELARRCKRRAHASAAAAHLLLLHADALRMGSSGAVPGSDWTGQGSARLARTRDARALPYLGSQR